jgi:AcrR family transcriptional regulator
MVARHVTLKALRGEARRYRSPENAREAAILAAATKLFGARGYAGTRTADVAAKAGVTERTLFRYFPTKDKLYRRVMFPALLSVAAPQALLDAGALFASDAETYGDWHRRVLTLRVAAAREAAAQFRLLVAGLMTDEALRRKVIAIWQENVLEPLVGTLERFQKRGELRADIPAERIARGILSLNLGYIFARALLAPEAKWDDQTEIAATVELMLHGAAKD